MLALEQQGSLQSEGNSELTQINGAQKLYHFLLRYPNVVNKYQKPLNTTLATVSHQRN